MPENEFEKQVQDRLRDLKLSPGDPVWEKVRRAIAQKKKRRRILFLLPLLAGMLLLGYGGYRFLGPSRQPVTIATPLPRDSGNKESNPSERKETEPRIPNQAATSQPNLQPAGNQPSRDSSTQRIKKETKQSGTASTSGPKAKLQTNANQETPLVTSPEKKLLPTRTKELIARTRTLTPSQPNQPTIQSIPLEARDTTSIAPKVAENKGSLAADTLAVLSDGLLKDSSAHPTSVTIPGTLPTTDETKPVTAIAKKKLHHGTQIGFTFSAGHSDVRRKIFSFSESSLKTADVGTVIGNPGGPPANVIQPPSETKRGPAYKAGISWEKNIGKRTKILSGLSYAFYSDQVRVGQRTNAPLYIQYGNPSSGFGNQVNGYYPAQTFESFTNRFHFIEIPVELEWQLNKGRKVGVTWDAGFSLGRLISTNALVYDTAAGGVYFHDRSLFNKNHISLLSGLSFHFRTHGIDAAVGPAWSVDMTRSVNQGFDRSKYLLGTYLKAQVMFVKKSKK